MEAKTLRRLAALTAALLGIGGCGGPQQAEQPAEPKTETRKGRITVCLLPKQKGIPYFTSCAEGAQEAAKELDVELIYDGPTDGSPEKAAAMVEKWALQGVDAICVSPNDPNVLAPAMKAARAKGVRVITWDADAPKDSREVFVNQATAQQIGSALVDTLAKDLGGAGAKGHVAIITATATAANQNEWIVHIKERLKAYPGLKLTAVVPSNEDQKLAFQAAQDLIKADPELKGILAISSTAFPGAAEGIRQAGKAGVVQVTGLSTPNDMRALVKNGTVKSVILWNTRDLGYLTVQVAAQLARGEFKGTDATIKAGRLGEKRVEGDSVLLGGILVFDKANIDRYRF
ncbi:MAG: substrate-binding domain-containing protein [Fimbriimonadales bacterium]|nr:substrate-binding domain-containing protein [Fimbriimonadales bacterium]